MLTPAAPSTELVRTAGDTYKRQYLESDRKTESQKQMYQIVYFLRWNAIIGIGIVGAVGLIAAEEDMVLSCLRG